MGTDRDWNAEGRIWAERVAAAYRTTDGMELDEANRRTLAEYVASPITTSLILYIPGNDWGYAQVNPAIGQWEAVMRLRRGFRLLTVDEGHGTLTMGLDPRAR